MSEQPQRCPGPRQHGHSLVYESHCDHGETKAHDIQQAQVEDSPWREWTPEYVQSLGAMDRICAEVVAEAHKAAVAVERTKLEIMVCERNGEIKRLQQQLFAERQKVESAQQEMGEQMELNDQLRQQLAAEYAKGREHNDVAITQPLRQQLAAAKDEFEELEQLYRENNQDHYKQVGELQRQLAALQESKGQFAPTDIDAIRKPLVDALEKARDHIDPAKSPSRYTNIQMVIQIDDALAKAKEGK